MPPQNGGYKKKTWESCFCLSHDTGLGVPFRKDKQRNSPRQDDIQQISTPFTGADD